MPSNNVVERSGSDVVTLNSRTLTPSKKEMAEQGKDPKDYAVQYTPKVSFENCEGEKILQLAAEHVIVCFAQEARNKGNAYIQQLKGKVVPIDANVFPKGGQKKSAFDKADSLIEKATSEGKLSAEDLEALVAKAQAKIAEMQTK